MALIDLEDAACTFEFCKCALQMMKEDAAVKVLDASSVESVYLNIAKILFTRSKTQQHDADFFRIGLLTPILDLLHSCALDRRLSDVMVYIVGSLKNVATAEENQKVLVTSGALQALFSLVTRGHLTGSPQEASLLIQITGAMRSLAEHGSDEFLAEDRLRRLTEIMDVFPKHEELLTNVSRTLAKLSLHDSLCVAFESSDVHLQRISRTLRDNLDVAPLTLRLCFVLGTLTAKSNQLLEKFSFECKGTALVSELLTAYWERDRQLLRADSHKGTCAAKSIEEVLVALVRLIANMAISAPTGNVLAADPAVVDPLIDMLGAKRIAESEELVLNVVAAVTNMTCHDASSNRLLTEHKLLLCRLLRPLLLESYNIEALLETARSLGNLSRHEDARRCMAEIRLDEVLVILLDHDDLELVFYVCGVLVNMAADRECAMRLLGVCPTVAKLTNLLADAPSEHADLQFVIVQALANLAIDHELISAVGAVESLRTALESVLEMMTRQCADAEQTDRHRQVVQLASRTLEQLPPS